jgi:hypothetical protein
VTARPARMTLLALATAVIVGGAVGALSQMTAVSVADPRPSTPPPSVAPTPAPTVQASPSAAATATPQPQRADVWLYTIAQGDSLSALAIRWGTTTGALLTLNPSYAENEDLVQAGSQVIMPCTPIAVAEKRC